MPVVGANVVAPVAEDKEWELLPVDVFQFELLDIDKKMQTKYQSTEEEEVLVFTFAVVEEGEHYGRRMWQYATPKLSKYKGGSNLYKTLVGLRGGVPFTDEECATPEVTCSDDALNSLIGKQVRISVGQKPKKDGTLKNTIESYLPIKEELLAFDSEKVGEGAAAPAAAAQEISFDE